MGSLVVRSVIRNPLRQGFTSGFHQLADPWRYSGTGTMPLFDHLIKIEVIPMNSFHDILLRKLAEHSNLDPRAIAALRLLSATPRAVEPHEDIVRQGDKPNVSIVVVEGTLARYHALPSGRRQYLSLHIAGDLPDAQTLFLDVTDHAVCAMDKAVVALVPHAAILKLFEAKPWWDLRSGARR